MTPLQEKVSSIENKYNIVQLRKIKKEQFLLFRLDGKTFSSWTRRMGLSKPYDHYMKTAMQVAALEVADHFNAKLVYLQSDEVTFLFSPVASESDIMFAGKSAKWLSILTSYFTSHFIYTFYDIKFSGKIVKPLPYFDCRGFQTKTLEDALDCVENRRLDFIRNSVSSYGRLFFSHKQLFEKKVPEVKQMLREEKNFSWEDQKAENKYGTMFIFQKRETTFSFEEIQKLPLKHEARTSPNLAVVRRVPDIFVPISFQQWTNRLLET